MRILYKKILRPFFFLFSADDIHLFILKVGNFLGRFKLTRALTKCLFHYKNKKLEIEVAGIKFENPIGLSAGFDKDADILDVLPSVGFGFAQVGTVTYTPYEGNPQPWSTRLKKSKALTVYYGLKNIGIKKLIERIKKRLVKDFPLSISIGMTNAKYTNTEKAGIKDYVDCLHDVEKAEIGDFYTINISCPNTFGGEPYTTPEKLDSLLIGIKTIKTDKPIFLKMPINIEWVDFKKLCDVALKYEIDGLIIGNLNKNRDDATIKDKIPENVNGSISGKPTEQLVNKLIAETYLEYGDKFTIIGVGGIFSAEDAYKKIKLGASLVQLITGMIYVGPQLIGDINRGLAGMLEKDGYDNIYQVIGSEHKK